MLSQLNNSLDDGIVHAYRFLVLLDHAEQPRVVADFQPFVRDGVLSHNRFSELFLELLFLVVLVPRRSPVLAELFVGVRETLLPNLRLPAMLVLKVRYLLPN